MYYLAIYYVLFMYYLVDVLFSTINNRMVNSKYNKIVNRQIVNHYALTTKHTI